MKKFPKEILIRFEEDRAAREEYPVITDLHEAAVPGASVRVARYRLVEVGAVVSAPEFVHEPTGKRKRPR